MNRLRWDGRRGWPVEVGDARLDERLATGTVDGVRWELELEPVAPPYGVPPRPLRPFASTQYVLWPAVLVSGRIGDHRLGAAPGHLGHVWGRRHAERWTWAHASFADGRWADVLHAKVRRLPALTVWATHERRGIALRGLGPFVADAERGDLAEVVYRDPDGSERTCFHAERGRLRGHGLESGTAAYEVGMRYKPPGWTSSR